MGCHGPGKVNGQIGHAGFSRRIGGAGSKATVLGRQGRHIDDDAFAAFLHVRQRRLGAEEGAAQIDSH